ncbi:MAG: hypothetical protein SFV24_10430 [Gemmatimonadales bacterium]|nr:hypothetical protein [Gemmatimonadales bacterium]
MQPIDFTTERLARLGRDPLIVTERPTIHEIEGPGAVTCLQGLVSADVVGPGPDGVGYGAVLTAKGMIVADYWILRDGDRFILIADRSAREASVASFRRLLPPRLARLTDRTDSWEVRWLIGRGWRERIEAAFGVRPVPGHAVNVGTEAEPLRLAAPKSNRVPFEFLLVGSAAAGLAADERLARAGGLTAEAADLRAARVLAGFPTLGAEIDDRTMPAEADFDALGGVSYQKGCYVGQETVARLHFRGHPNWHLRGLRFGPGGPIPDAIDADGKPVVRVGTVMALEDGTAVGLGRVRREVEPGTSLTAGDRTVRIAALPWEMASGNGS